MQEEKSKQNKTNKTTLYAIVYETRVVRYIATFVFVFFLVNPVIPALASEDDEVPVESSTSIVLDPGNITDAFAVEVPEVAIEEHEEDVETVVDEEVISTNENEVAIVAEEEVVTLNKTLTIEQEEAVNVQNVPRNDADLNETNDQEEDLGELLSEVGDTAFYNKITELLLEETIVSTASSSSAIASSSEIIVEESIAIAYSEEFTLESMISTSSDATSTENVGTIDTTESDTQEPATTHTMDTVKDVTIEETLDVDFIEETSSVVSQQGDAATLDEANVATTTKDIIFINENEVATTTEDDISINEDKIATTTIETTPPTQAVTVLLNANNTYQFGADECRSMGDGTFYCAEASQTTAVEEDAVYAEADEDGDLEIFVRLAGVVTQITHNLVDDSAPYYDALSNTIVWHSLLNDRYQIVSYDLDTDNTTVLTNTRYNNMQPMTHGDVSFWQAWIGGNWEIVRYENDEMIQMTDNDVHDIAPYALEDFVMWQTQNGDQWDVTLYDAEKDTTQIISSDTAGYTKNPRLVLMYESFDANGDMQVLGYDLRSKEYIPLSAIPTSLPQQLPEPDPIGEKKAFVNTKPSLRKDLEAEDLFVADGTDTSTSTDADLLQDSSTIIILANTALSEISASTSDVGVTASTSVAHIEDLIITPTASTTPIDQIDAVVIPSFVATTTAEVL